MTVDQSDIRGSEPPDKSSSWSCLALVPRVVPVTQTPLSITEGSPTCATPVLSQNLTASSVLFRVTLLRHLPDYAFACVAFISFTSQAITR